jgi:hypothetical protein
MKKLVTKIGNFIKNMHLLKFYTKNTKLVPLCVPGTKNLSIKEDLASVWESSDIKEVCK